MAKQLKILKPLEEGDTLLYSLPREGYITYTKGNYIHITCLAKDVPDLADSSVYCSIYLICVDGEKPSTGTYILRSFCVNGLPSELVLEGIAGSTLPFFKLKRIVKQIPTADFVLLNGEKVTNPELLKQLGIPQAVEVE